MEAVALCIGLIMNVLMLLVAQVQPNYTQESASAQIVPTALQVFEYRSILFDCVGFKATAGWTVMRSTQGQVSECVSTWVMATAAPCAIKPAYQADSGEYWCETGEERSNAVNITITGGDVILESPVRPVTEGDAVTLRCRNQRTSSAHIADFYKDDVPVGSGSTGEMTIRAVSRSDQGLYKCSISDFGESPRSRLTVRAAHAEAPPPTDQPSHHSCHIYLLLRTVFTALLVPLLLLLVGLLHCGKLRVTQKYVCVCEVCEGRCRPERSEGAKDGEQ